MTSTARQASRQWRQRVLLVALAFLCHRRTQRKRAHAAAMSSRLHTSILTGKAWVQELLDGHSKSFQHAARMPKRTFNKLVSILESRALLAPSRLLSVAGQLMLFLYVLGHRATNAELQERFQIGAESASLYFHDVLEALLAIYPDYVRLPNPAVIPRRIANNNKFYPAFKDTRGVLDGTHIPVLGLPPEVVNRSCNRHGQLTQNVLAVVDFDLRFLYLLARWEGSAHDSTVLDDAWKKGFEIPDGMYHLADASYVNSDCILSPYRGVQYHLKEWGSAHERPANAHKFFNLRHAQLRNAIECAFGVVKRHFPLLATSVWYLFEQTQPKIVYVAALLHNLIIDGKQDMVPDRYERTARRGALDDNDRGALQPPPGALDVPAADWRQEGIADRLWAGYQHVLATRAWAVPPSHRRWSRFFGESLDLWE